MPIRKYLVDKPAFSLETIAAMSKAFEGACIALRVYAGDEKGRAGARGQLLVCSRYVVLPAGRRIDIRPRPPAQPRAVPLKCTSGHRKPAPVKDSQQP